MTRRAGAQSARAARPRRSRRRARLPSTAGVPPGWPRSGSPGPAGRDAGPACPTASPRWPADPDRLRPQRPGRVQPGAACRTPKTCSAGRASGCGCRPDHTVVALAGGTGSGKSSLFNRLAGADFSPVGVVRPMTRDAYACVWGVEGAGPAAGLARHDRAAPVCRVAARSTRAKARWAGCCCSTCPTTTRCWRVRRAGDRLVSLADLMVWVLDPQKYADAAVHSRYLVPMAGHSSVISVVLNQSDLLTPEQADDCVADLQRLLEAEGLHDSQVLLTSAVTGAGLADLRRLLTRPCRRAGRARRGSPPTWTPSRPGSPPTRRRRPTSRAGGEARAVTRAGAAFSRAAGVAGVGRALQSARELRAARLHRLAGFLAGRPVAPPRPGPQDPARHPVGRTARRDRRAAGAHQAEIDNAITALADEVAPGLPAPWPATARSAARSQVDADPRRARQRHRQRAAGREQRRPWWRLVAAWQGLLLGAAAAGAGLAGGADPDGALSRLAGTRRACSATSCCCRGSRSWSQRSSCSAGSPPAAA